MVKKFLHNAYYLIIPVLILGISVGYSTLSITFVALVLLLFLTNRHTIAIFFVIFGGPFAGIIRTMYPVVPIYGVLIELIGFVLMWDLIINLFQKQQKALYGLALVLALFGFFYLLGPRTEYAKDKYFSICTHGLLMLIGYYALDHSDKIDPEGLTRLLIVGSICMYAYIIKTAFIIPGSIFDYNWFREQYYMFENNRNDFDSLVLVDYQHIGMLALFSVAIYLSQIKLQLRLSVFYFLCASQLVLSSGCRQAIFGVAVIIAFRFAIFRKDFITNKNKVANLIWMTIGLLVSYFALFFFFDNLQSDVISSTLKNGDQGRMIHYLESLDIFRNNLVLGSGIGGYNAITGNPWPHNFILELLCETGIVGTIIFLFLLIIPLILKKVELLHLNASNQFFFLILMAIVTRVMVSGDFRISIELFSATLAVSAVNPITEKKKT